MTSGEYTYRHSFSRARKGSKACGKASSLVTSVDAHSLSRLFGKDDSTDLTLKGKRHIKNRKSEVNFFVSFLLHTVGKWDMLQRPWSLCVCANQMTWPALDVKLQIGTTQHTLFPIQTRTILCINTNNFVTISTNGWINILIITHFLHYENKS